MTAEEIAGIVISTILAAALTALSVTLYCGKGGRFVPTYRYEPKAPEAKKYHLRLMRIAAAFVFSATAMVYAGIMCIIFEVAGDTQSLGGVMTGVGILIAISGVLYMSTNESVLLLKRKARDDYWDKRFHEEGEEELKKEFSYEKTAKKRKITTFKKTTERSKRK